MATGKMVTKCIESLLLLVCLLTLTYAGCNCKGGCAGDDEICTECVDGFHGNRCQSPCSHTCKSLDGVVACDKASGRCLNGCTDEYYGDTCESHCPFGCKRCTSLTNCSVCFSDAYWGETCGQSCPMQCDGYRCSIKGVCDRCRTGWGGQGYYGDQCDQKCSESIPDCRQCSGDGQKCQVCRSAKFGQQCERTCPDHCSECSSALNCSQCEPGYSGDVCDQACRPGCKYCDIQGRCLQCENGKFGDGCDQKCNQFCHDRSGRWSCDKMDGACKRCAEGFYGTHCEQNCSLSCVRGCGKSSGECKRCPSGYYGKYSCDMKCPSNCAANEPNNLFHDQELCDKLNGECNRCKAGFYGKRCEDNCNKNCTSKYFDFGCDQEDGHCFDCSTGRYGNYCEKSCSTNCQSWTEAEQGHCDKVSGRCILGCWNGWFGETCQRECSLSCLETMCNRNGGMCSLGCKDGWFGETCRSNCGNCLKRSCNQEDGMCTGGCIDGWFNKTCQSNCSKNCLASRCNQTDGMCTGGCKDGWFGETCRSNCGNCLKISCNQEDGICTGGCIDGWFGETCQSNCNENCLEGRCNQQDGKCTEGCKDGWFGETCQSNCSENCQERRCNQMNGMCTLGCKDGWFGETCQSNCSENCFESKCNQTDGMCTLGCKDGWFGETCQSNCSENCQERRCNQMNGMCTGGCKDGWFDETCQSNCNENCLVTRCNQQDGLCTEGCKDGWFDETCQSNCNENCLEGRCNQQDGKCTEGCKYGWFDETCESNCSKNCLVTRCNQEDGICTYGCVSGYIGDSCQDEETQADMGEEGTGTLVTIAYIGLGCLVVPMVLLSICLCVSRMRRQQAKDTGLSAGDTQELPLHTLGNGAGTQGNAALYANANAAVVNLQEERSDPNIEVVADLQLFKDRLLSDGRGTPVYEGVFEDSIPVAVKKIHLTVPQYAEELLEHMKILREVETLRKLPGHNHKNIVRYLKSVKTPHFLYIAFELCQGTLEAYVDPQKSWSEELPWEDVLTHMANGLQFLHVTVNMAHRDLKPSNVLLYKSTFDTKVVLADFGQSKMMTNMQCSMTGATGSLGWIAPEAEKTQGSYYTDSDIFSLGCLFYYVATKGNHPFGEYPLERQTNISQNKSDLGVLQPYQGCLRELITDMIQVNHEDRPSAELVSEHPSLLADDVIMDFLHKASNKINGYPLSQQNILEDPTIIPGGSWTQLLPVNTQAHLSTYTLPRHKQPMFKGREQSVRHLLRAIRNCSEHFPDLPAAVRAEMGASTPDHVQFWLRLYPWLLTHVYSNMKSDKSLMDSIRKA